MASKPIIDQYWTYQKLGSQIFLVGEDGTKVCELLDADETMRIFVAGYICGGQSQTVARRRREKVEGWGEV